MEFYDNYPEKKGVFFVNNAKSNSALSQHIHAQATQNSINTRFRNLETHLAIRMNRKKRRQEINLSLLSQYSQPLPTSSISLFLTK